MSAYRDLFETNLTYLQYVAEQTKVSHQYVRNIAAAGGGCEREIRTLLARYLPNRLRVTHGYVVKAVSRTAVPVVSQQQDVIVVDETVPNRLWIVDDLSGMEVVPYEAVVGIFEAKRTLTKVYLQAAITHLHEFVTTMSVTKDDPRTYLLSGMSVGSGLTGGAHANLMIGVLGLLSDDAVKASPVQVVDECVRVAAGRGPRLALDMVAALDGVLAATVDATGQQFGVHNVRTAGVAYPLVEKSVAGIWTNRAILAQTIGFIQAYLNNAAGRRADVEAYFFNDAIQA
jgi:hypothetical protein